MHVIRNCFKPLHIPTGDLDTTVPVKVYAGDNETDSPEFEETEVRHTSLADFLATSRGASEQVKFMLPCEALQLSEQATRAIKDVVDRHPFEPGVRKRVTTNMRISTRDWRFPTHTDPGNQLVLHLVGSKRWSSGAESVDVHAGDVLYLPIELPHSTRNLSDVCVIANYTWAYETDDYAAAEARSRHKYTQRTANLSRHGDQFYL